MKEKQTRNKFRDTIGDYYLTNRQISKENAEACKNKDMTKFSNIEKGYVIAILVGILLIVLKYFIF